MCQCALLPRFRSTSRWRTARLRILGPVLLSLLGLVSLLPIVPAGEAPDKVGLGSQTVNVIVINFDPVLKTRQNLKLHEYMKWSDPWQLTEKMVEDARLASAGYVDYRVVEKIEHDGFTTFRNGFTYTEESFLKIWENDRASANKGMTSFK